MQATHAFDAASEKELSLGVGDYVVVRKVLSSFPVNLYIYFFEILFSSFYCTYTARQICPLSERTNVYEQFLKENVTL